MSDWLPACPQCGAHVDTARDEPDEWKERPIIRVWRWTLLPCGHPLSIVETFPEDQDGPRDLRWTQGEVMASLVKKPVL